ncbi:DUF1479-domain-containing protein [Terfezia boudieri ATCC MYA-4762]|uniref:DUF1479-domain-containing protein n=1 Tax=Terfezia boudieri ATCC MYA-4762 TaxID=1051890 RepID=A0A3N4LP92_9PEZI|nr:DUF1479-domain-containing protein [Terfezia boudieri ATCC MYA-4762]
MLRIPLRIAVAPSPRHLSLSLSLQRMRKIGTIPNSPHTSIPPPLPPTSPLSAPDTPPRPAKAVGDISSIFPSLSSNPTPPTPLPQRFADVKANLIQNTSPETLQASWDKLLSELAKELVEIRKLGSDVIPAVDYKDLKDAERDKKMLQEIRKRGAVIVKGVMGEGEVLQMKDQVKKYLQDNQGRVKAFPATSPSVYEIYWSPPQIRARTHPNLLTTHRFLLSSLFASPLPDSQINLTNPLSYADRLRIRPPGDARFALGPHVDAGSVERWEDPTYASAYSPIWAGNWPSYDPFSAEGMEMRERGVLDMYNGAGACSMLRLWQGWLSLSHTSPGEGTLRVFPLLKQSTAYILLRPFFSPDATTGKWTFTNPITSALPGSIPSFTQELNPTTHPHLALDNGGMVSMPTVKPGDYVAWHGDAIHAVESIHAGKGDSSVFYIPAVPDSLRNREFLKRQREEMETGGVPPDFPGAGVETEGERGWAGKGGWEHVHEEGDRRVLGWGLREGEE